MIEIQDSKSMSNTLNKCSLEDVTRRLLIVSQEMKRRGNHKKKKKGRGEKRMRKIAKDFSQTSHVTKQTSTRLSLPPLSKLHGQSERNLVPFRHGDI